MNRARRDVAELLALGRVLDDRLPALEGDTVGVRMAAALLRVRGRDGLEQALRANAAQRAFERRRERQNVVLKARQMGMTTWVAGRCFLETIPGRGVLTEQLAAVLGGPAGRLATGGVAAKQSECGADDLSGAGQ